MLASTLGASLLGATLRRFPRRQLSTLALLFPGVFYIGLFFAYPLAGVLGRSLFSPSLTLEHYGHLLAEPVYLQVVYLTFEVAFLVAGTCLLLGYPLAYVLSALRPRVAGLLLILVIVPHFTSTLVRTYAWIVVLGTEGLLNQALIALGLTSAPLKLLYNRTGVLIGMTYILLPYVVLTLFSVMRGIDHSLLQAAASLGASRHRTFWRVFFPLSLPGVVGGGLLVFIFALGFFITPALMGGPRETMVAMVIEQQVEVLFNWGFASALAVVLLALTLVGFFVYHRLLGFDRVFEAKP